MLFSSINCFYSRQFRSSPSISSAMDLGGVRRKMTRKNCERINAVKMVKVYNRYGEETVNGYGFKNVGSSRTTF